VSDVTIAVRVVHGKGFTPLATTDLTQPPVNGLHVIIARASGSAAGHTERAFFFVHGRFLRADLPDPSSAVHVAWRNNTTVALAYATYKPKEPICCPTGGSIIVRYEWTGTRLKALDPIPPVAVRR
jgi:hypothetical protein